MDLSSIKHSIFRMVAVNLIKDWECENEGLLEVMQFREHIAQLCWEAGIIYCGIFPRWLISI